MFVYIVAERLFFIFFHFSLAVTGKKRKFASDWYFGALAAGISH